MPHVSSKKSRGLSNSYVSTRNTIIIGKVGKNYTCVTGVSLSALRCPPGFYVTRIPKGNLVLFIVCVMPTNYLE